MAKKSEPLDPIVMAHQQLDEWIRGEIKAGPGSPYTDQLSTNGAGVIWLGRLQITMVSARNFYHQEHGKPQPRPQTIFKPRKSPATDAAVTTENKRGEEVPATPLPHYGLRKRCSCGAKFWRERKYREHYALQHIVDGVYPL